MAANIYFSRFSKLEVQSQVTGRLSVWWGPSCRFTEGHHFPLSLQGSRSEGPFGTFVRALIKLINISPNGPITCQRPCLQKHHTGEQFQQMNGVGVGGQAYSGYDVYWYSSVNVCVSYWPIALGTLSKDPQLDPTPTAQAPGWRVPEPTVGMGIWVWKIIQMKPL